MTSTAALAACLVALSATPALGQQAERPREPRDAPDRGGLVARVGLIAVVPTGKFADAAGLGMPAYGTGQGVSFSAGYYPVRSVGLLAGFRYTFNHDGAEDCAKGCSGMTTQFPVVVELAPRGRKEWLYAQAGLGLFTRYFGYAPVQVGQQPITVESIFSNDVFEYKLALGYRFPLGPHPTEWSVDAALGADIGRFHRQYISSPIETRSGSISDKAWHVTLGFTLALIHTH